MKLLKNLCLFNLFILLPILTSAQNKTIVNFFNSTTQIIGYHENDLTVYVTRKMNVQHNSNGFVIGGGGNIAVRIDPVKYKTIRQIVIVYSTHKALTGEITFDISGGGINRELSQRLDPNSNSCVFGDNNAKIHLITGDYFTLGVHCTKNRLSSDENVTLQGFTIFWDD